MRGWRVKFILVLIVYFAGFATAIYTLAPAPEGRAAATEKKSFTFSAFKSDEFAKSFNEGMHKCIEFGKDAAVHAAEVIKEELAERRAKADG